MTLKAQNEARERIELQTKHATETRKNAAIVAKQAQAHEAEFLHACHEREAAAERFEERAIARSAERLAHNEKECQRRLDLVQLHMERAEGMHEAARSLVRHAAADCWRQGIPQAASSLLRAANL